jgi:hypothetical protein
VGRFSLIPTRSKSTPDSPLAAEFSKVFLILPHKSQLHQILNEIGSPAGALSFDGSVPQLRHALQAPVSCHGRRKDASEVRIISQAAHHIKR